MLLLFIALYLIATLFIGWWASRRVKSAAFSLVALFIPLMAGIYWKKTSPFGAMAGMLSGLAGWLIAQWTEPWRAGIWLEIPAVFYGLGVNALALCLGSLLRPGTRKGAQEILCHSA